VLQQELMVLSQIYVVVNTKVEIRFHVQSAKWIPNWIKPNLMEKVVICFPLFYLYIYIVPLM